MGQLDFVRLKGILSGITTDKQINEKELLFLDAWLRDRLEYAAGDGDVTDLLQQISDVLEDGVITQEEMEDTLSLIDCILEYRENPPETTSLQEVFGFIQGVVSDGIVTDKELRNVLKIVAQNIHVPMCALLAERLKKAATNDEKVALLKSFSGHYFEETGTTQNWSSFLSDNLPDDYDFQGKKVCFTGEVIGVPRSTLKSHLNKLGGLITKTVSKNTDILVVGDGCSKGWIQSNYGTKLDSACKLKLSGVELLIVSADEWISKSHNRIDPLLGVRSKVQAIFGSPVCMDEAFDKAKQLCENSPLSVIRYRDEAYEGIAIIRGSESYMRGEFALALIEHRDDGYELEGSKPWAVSGETQGTVNYSKSRSAFDKFGEHLARAFAACSQTTD
ncbi:BRCT domain-containing protein [Vibrio navarrensis]|nr:BRCT domain-containing protein [Vibrio navarrensis]